MATLINPNEKPKAIKNLGWLLRNWQQVEWLGFNYSADDQKMRDGELVAKLKNGGVYLTEYASLNVCWSFVNRPVFKGLKFSLAKMTPAASVRTSDHEMIPVNFIVGSDEWNTIQKMDYSDFSKFISSLFKQS